MDRVSVPLGYVLGPDGVGSLYTENLGAPRKSSVYTDMGELDREIVSGDITGWGKGGNGDGGALSLGSSRSR